MFVKILTGFRTGYCLRTGLSPVLFLDSEDFNVFNFLPKNEDATFQQNDFFIKLFLNFRITSQINFLPVLWFWKRSFVHGTLY